MVVEEAFEEVSGYNCCLAFGAGGAGSDALDED